MGMPVPTDMLVVLGGTTSGGSSQCDSSVGVHSSRRYTTREVIPERARARETKKLGSIFWRDRHYGGGANARKAWGRNVRVWVSQTPKEVGDLVQAMNGGRFRWSRLRNPHREPASTSSTCSDQVVGFRL